MEEKMKMVAGEKQGVKSGVPQTSPTLPPLQLALLQFSGHPPGPQQKDVQQNLVFVIKIVIPEVRVRPMDIGDPHPSLVIGESETDALMDMTAGFMRERQDINDTESGSHQRP